MMRMDIRMVQTQSQRLMLTLKMQQALQILQYNTQELDLHVQHELETNPVLEQVSPEPAPEPMPENKSENGQDGPDANDIVFDLDQFISPWEQRIKEGRDLSINPEIAERRDYYLNSITKEESLSARLIRQLRLAFDDDERYAIGELIVGDINERGYFTGSLEEIAQSLEVPLADVERVLYRIQHFEPVGIGARDIVECLLLQLNTEYPEAGELRELVEFHFDELQHRQIVKIAKAMRITPEHVEELRRTLSTLDPWPGLEFSAEATQYISPELLVEKLDGEYVVSLTSEGSPQLLINQEYQAMAKQKDIEKEEKKYLREKVEAARWLIRNIEQRQQTILKIGKAIMDVQHEFLDKGVDKIKPLTLQEIADVVGVHEATVSRTTRGKYIQTPQGLHELKYFFSPGLKRAGGEDQSSKSVQLKVKKIIADEDKRKPLSDQKIADLLKADGLKIARRTITKYREGLGIPATTMRKEF